MSRTGMTMVLVCAGSVTFLLSVLTALVKELVGGPPLTVRAIGTKFTPAGRRADVIAMNFEDLKSKNRKSTDQRRIAL